MAMLSARQPIEDYLIANWPEVDVPLVFENAIAPNPDPPAPWIYVEIYDRSYQQKSIGSGDPDVEFWREEGVLTGYVNVPIGTGAREASRLAQVLVMLLRGVVIGDANITFYDSTVGAGDPGTERGKYWQLVAKIDWERN